MKLRYRIALIVCIALAIKLVGVQIIASTILRNNYEDIEREDAREDVERANNAFHQRVLNLHERSKDWVDDSDTHRSILAHHAPNLTASLLEDALDTLCLDTVLYLDTRGKVISQKSGQGLPLSDRANPDQIRAAIKFSSAAEAQQHVGDFSGVINLPAAPMMISAQPIVSGDERGQTQGWLVFGRYFDKAELDALAKQSQFKLDAIRSEQFSKFPDVAQVMRHMRTSNEKFVQPLDAHTLRGYAVIHDLQGNSIGVLRVELPRKIFQSGLTGLDQITHLFLAAGLTFGLILMLAIEYFVASRLTNLTCQVEKVGASNGRIELKGSDELALLAAKINGMVDEIAGNEQQLIEYYVNMEHLVLTRTEELAHQNSVLEHAVEGIGLTGADGMFVAVNSAFAEIVGCEPSDMIGSKWQQWIDYNDVARIRDCIAGLTDASKVEQQVVGLRTDGTRIDLEITLFPDGGETGLIGATHWFAKDISRRLHLESQLAHQAFHDTLTGLPNRALFMDRLEQALLRIGRSNLQVAVIFLDLDRFKIVNDSMGHAAGDVLLKEITSRLQSAARSADTIARLAGDEFTLILENVKSAEDVAQVAERIVATVREPISIQGRDVVVSGSVGVALTGDTHMLADELLHEADTAMYRAKANGKSCYVIFEPNMDDEAMERVEIEMELRTAIDKNQLQVYYQPLLDLATGRTSGMEALVRWHTDHGLIMPGKFIPIAEETGLIIPIGYWVLEQSCLQVKQWHEQYPDNLPFTVNVNLSGRQIQCEDVVERVEAILKSTGVDPGSVKLEITESTFMADLDAVNAKLFRLKQLGVKLAIDDFGTGYSSLSTLKSFPVDTVKIDRAFVSRLGEEDEAGALVSAIVMVAKTLGMDVTGEGIEMDRQVAMLQSLGCQIGQGYMFGKPMPANEFASLLESGSIVQFSPSAQANDEVQRLLNDLPSNQLEDAA